MDDHPLSPYENVSIGDTIGKYLFYMNIYLSITIAIYLSIHCIVRKKGKFLWFLLRERFTTILSTSSFPIASFPEDQL